MHKDYSELEQEIATEKSRVDDKDYDAFVKQTLNEIRSLSITADF